MLRLAVASLLLFPAIAIGQDVSGEGDGFVVAVDHDTKTITGYYSSGTGQNDASNGPQFSCIFFLLGKTESKPPYRIVTWFPAVRSEVIEGDLKFSNDASGHAVTIRLKEEHGGCANVEHFAASEGGATLQLDRTGTWSGIRIVAAKKAHFFPAAGAVQPLRSFVTTGDALKISSTQPGWVQATYTNPDNKSTQGWIKEGELFPAAPPSRKP